MPIIRENESAILMERRADTLPAFRKILIAAHPGDLDLARQIGEEILSIRNYEIRIPKDGGMLSGDLTGTDLIVFVVSKAFLGTENPARCRVFPAALALGDALLLMIQTEKGLMADFNRLCGPYQLLDRTGADYSVKLRRYFDGHADPYRLIGEADVLSSRKELLSFRIFISYRKKDRAYLQRVVEAIRSRPQLQDAAVWYDDSLISGENYNDQIDRALVGADLVLFAATDRCSEAGNYVLVNEYPRAAEEHKPMLFIARAGTDGEALRQSFPQAQRLFSFEETEAWLDRIVRVRSALGKARTPLSPYELFALALEYEDGFRTARDPSLAIRLLEQSAAAGWIPAMTRLAGYTLDGTIPGGDPCRAMDLLLAARSAYQNRAVGRRVPSSEGGRRPAVSGTPPRSCFRSFSKGSFMRTRKRCFGSKTLPGKKRGRTGSSSVPRGRFFTKPSSVMKRGN